MTRPASGIEQILEKASEDREFCGKLAAAEGDARSGLAKTAGISLTEDEAAILASTSTKQLEQMLDQVAAAHRRRRAFIRGAIGTAVVVSAGGVCALLATPRMLVSQGIRIDLPTGRFLGWVITDDMVGPRSAEDIVAALRSAWPESAAATWVVGPAGSPPPQSVEYRLVVSPDGEVLSANMVRRDPKIDQSVPRFLSMILRKGAPFAPADGTTECTLRFVFEPR